MNDKQRREWNFEDGGFAVLVLAVTFAFAWLMTPYFGAILWGLVAAIVFEPIYQRMVVSLGGRKGLAAAHTLLLILAVVIVPALLLGVSLIEEAAGLYRQLQSGGIDIGEIVGKLRSALPPWISRQAADYGLLDAEHLRGVLRTGLSSGLGSVATQALTVGQGALSFLAALGVMLYLTYFLLRDGDRLSSKLRSAMPLQPELRDRLVDKFLRVVRATIKGTVLVAVLQGIVGGLIFWVLGIHAPLLWGLLMGFFSLVPAVGTGIVWVPVAFYLLVTGSIWQGLVLVFCGFFVIGLIDNLLRPILVGKDTKLPDFVVLIATVAGLELFGLSGFIIGPIIAALFIAVWDIVTELRGRFTPPG